MEQNIEDIINMQALPEHVAIIMDGNRRWAKKNNLSTPQGHKEGAENLKRIAKFANKIGIKHLTVYAFSTENWKRSQEEVGAIMKLLKFYLLDFFNWSDENIKINVLGRIAELPKDLKDQIHKIEEKTKNNTGLVLNICFNYGGRDEIVTATKNIVQKVLDGELKIEDINEKCIKNVVMEVSSHALAQHRVDFCDFNGAVFTNLTQDHLDFHITMNNYFKAKAILFENLVAGDFAVINKDDEYSERFINAVSPTVSLYTYGIKNDADIKAKDVVFNHSGASFTCIVKDREYKVNLKMNGMFSVYNVLAALTTALALGMDIEKSIKTLEEIGGVAGRFEVIVNKPAVIVDYAHTPDGLENVLKAARDITPSDGRLICLFGCGGDRDATKRPKMGAIAEELADVVIVTSDNPRSEEPQQIITDILAGLKSVNEVIVEPDRELAIKEAHKIARENDVVLIAGKGHEDYQILANETIHFDDREKAREIFVQ